MRQLSKLLGAFAGVALLGLGGPVAADDTGVAGIHTWVRSGGKTCLADHYHDGSGSGPTRARAQAAAIRAWVDFTSWEYGSNWGRYGAAASKSMSCSKDGGSWSCHTQARPCRGY